MSDDAADLVRRQLDGLLDDAGRARLEALLESDPEARRIYVAELRLHAELHVRLQGVGRPVERRRPRIFRGGSPPSVAPWIAAAAVFLFALLVLAAFQTPPARPAIAKAPPPKPARPAEPEPSVEAPPLPPREPIVTPTPAPPPPTPAPEPVVAPPPPPAPAPPRPPSPPPVTVAAIARLETVEGDVLLSSGERARSGLDLLGGGLACGAGASAELVFPDGTRAKLAGELSRVEDKLLLLERGALDVRAARQAPGRPFRVRTPHAEAVVLGTAFRLRILAEGTRLDVAEGRVRLTRGAGGAAEVGAGHYALAGPAWTPLPRPLPKTPLEAALAARGAVTINFGPEGLALPEGTLNDAGRDFDPALGYGWSGEERGTARRERPSDLLRATHVYAGSRARASLWTARVPNGTYLVSLCVGDDRPQGPHHVALQGRLVLDARSSAADQYLEIKDIPAVVKDGTLTIAAGGHQKPSVGRGADTTLCWIQLRFAR